MRTPRRITIIAKERPFDADKWQQLLTAFAYALHEQRKVDALAAKPLPPTTSDGAPTRRTP